jgi:hypothetical protein
MADTFRITGKIETSLNEPLYLMEFEIKRSLLIDKNNFKALIGALSEGNENNQLDGLINIIRTSFEDDVFPKNTLQMRSPWQTVKLTNESILQLAKFLKSQDDEVVLHASGTPDSGGMQLTAVIAGATFTQTVTSTAQAMAFSSKMLQYKDDMIEAGLKGKVVGKLVDLAGKCADWALRAAGVYDLAEKAWESAQKAIESRAAQDREERYHKEHIEREKKAGIERAEQWDFADKVSRTA